MSPGLKYGFMLPESTVSVRYQPRFGSSPSRTSAQQREGQEEPRRQVGEAAALPGASVAHETYLLVAVRWVPVKA